MRTLLPNIPVLGLLRLLGLLGLPALGACQMPESNSDRPRTDQEPVVTDAPDEPAPSDQHAAIGAVIDDWHDAAAQADEARYLGHFSEDAVFMGTDATERWTLAEFGEYVRKYFPDRIENGQTKQGGWTYLPHDRFITLAADGQVAWFDEQLTNEGYGELRGTGVLRLEDERWRLAHYSMTFTVPNGIGKTVVRTIREFQGQR